MRSERMLYVIGLVLTFAVGTTLAADAAKGQTLYAAKCAMCHAKDLKGNPAMAKVFKIDVGLLNMTSKATQDRSDADLTKVVTDGVNKMPAYKGKLTDAQIAEVVAYLRTFAPPK